MEVKSSYLRRRGDSWQGVAKYDDGGRERRTYRSFGAVSKHDAARLLRRWLVELEDGPVPEPARVVAAQPVAAPAVPPSVDVVSYCTSLVESRLSLRQIERSTAYDYLRSIRAWSPWLSGVPMASLTRESIETAMASMLSRGLSPRTVSKRLVTLRMALRDAESRGLVERDPSALVGRPRVAEGPKNCLPKQERDRLLSALAPGSRLMVAVALGLLCGLRRGEVCGLQAWDVEDGRLWVRRSVGVAPGGTYAKPPKSGHVRDVPLPPVAADALSGWASAHPMGPNDYLMTGTGSPWSPTLLSREWSALADALGLVGVLGRRPTFHDLRHTYATVAISAGVDVKTVSSVLGHADASMTLNVYAVADPSAKAASASLVGAAM